MEFSDIGAAASETRSNTPDCSEGMPPFWLSRLSGKSVCIVGNGPMPPSREVDIDMHDVIFRFNDCIRGGPWGSRTSFYCTTLRKEVRTKPEDVLGEDVSLVLTGTETSGENGLTWGFLGRKLAQGLGCWPSSGLMAAFLACACKAAHLTLTAMTFAYPLQRHPSWDRRYAPPWSYHNFLGERRILSGLLMDFAGSVRLPTALEELRYGAFNHRDPRWSAIASTLSTACRNGRDCQWSLDNDPGELDPDVRDLMQGASRALSELAPSMEGVRQLEPFFHLPRGMRRLDERWMLFHPAAAILLDQMTARLRKMQTTSASG